MKQILNSNIDPIWPNVEIHYKKPVELFIDSYYNYNQQKNSFKIFYLREPDVITNIKQNVITNSHLFDAIITYDKEVLEKCSNAYLLEFGTTWIHDYTFPEKQFQISHLTGQKNISDGHLLRQKVYYNQLKINQKKDFYISRLWNIENEFNNKILTDKKEPLFDSQFHICIENTKIENYFTEKLLDCFLTKTIPIYYGCSNIQNYFNVNGMYIVNNISEIITTCNSLTEHMYEKLLPSIEANFETAKKYKDLISRFKNKTQEILNNEK